VSGRLVGGCLDVLEFLKGTPWWIPKKSWDGAIFFAETSEEAPAPNVVGYWLRNYGSQGILERISGMMVARPMRYTREMTATLHRDTPRAGGIRPGRFAGRREHGFRPHQPADGGPDGMPRDDRSSREACCVTGITGRVTSIRLRPRKHRVPAAIEAAAEIISRFTHALRRIARPTFS